MTSPPLRNRHWGALLAQSREHVSLYPWVGCSGPMLGQSLLKKERKKQALYFIWRLPRRPVCYLTMANQEAWADLGPLRRGEATTSWRYHRQNGGGDFADLVSSPQVRGLNKTSKQYTWNNRDYWNILQLLRNPQTEVSFLGFAVSSHHRALGFQTLCQKGTSIQMNTSYCSCINESDPNTGRSAFCSSRGISGD